MQTNTTRDKTIDFIKGILILFVILGHTTLGLTDMYSFDDTMYGIANVIYSFHMPCFIAVSGFLYSESRHSMSKQLLKTAQIEAPFYN